MNSAERRRLPDGRWHFHHGPIDCVVFAEPLTPSAADAQVVDAATDACWRRFEGVLEALVDELSLLRVDLSSPASASTAPRGPVAARMVAACRPHARGGRFITAMAAVAGSVADELVDCLDHPRIARAYVNDGGDVALHLAPGARLDVGVVADLGAALAGHAPGGALVVDHASAVRGLATSGWRGRSLSLGIADAVTVLALDGAAADAAATVIANAVDVDVPGIARRPACEVRDDSDLGERLVTIGVARLAPCDVSAALDAGARLAEAEIAAGRIVAAVLQLQGSVRVCGTIGVSRPSLAVSAEPLPC